MNSIIITIIIVAKNSFASISDQREFYQTALARVTAETGQTFNVRERKRRKDPCEKFSFKIIDNLDRSYCYRRRSLGLTVWLVPPLIENGIDYTAGVASGICAPYGSAYATMRRFNGKGEDRVEASITAIEHELGHLLGASHITDGNIMTPYYVPADTHHFSPLSISQMRACAEKTLKLRRRPGIKIQP